MKKGIAIAALWALLPGAGTALAHKAHSHGVARLDIAAEGTGLRIELAVALEDLVGFEREPKDDREKAALEAAAAKLRDVAAIVVPAADAKCKAAEFSVEVGRAEKGHAEAQ